MSLRPLFTIIFLYSTLSAFSQSKDNAVFLKWKLKAGEVLSYKTIMEEIDTANHKDMSMAGFNQVLGLKGDSALDAEFKNMIRQLNAQVQHSNFITKLTEKRKGIIDIALYAKNGNSDTIAARAASKGPNGISISAGLPAGVMLRGAIYEDGSIESFYTKNEQKNLLAIFFELPARAVKPGDTWPLSVNFISMDQNFVCDSSYKRNTVKLVGIENKNGEHIATLRYDIEEYVRGVFVNTNTFMKMSFQGIAGFSLEKGRWVSYDGVMVLSSDGFMTSQTTKKLSLVAE
jgi:hypothetical protein